MSPFLLADAPLPETKGAEVSWGAQNLSSKPAASPVEYEVFTVDGDPIIVPQDRSQVHYTDTWAIPAAVVLLLLIAAGVGFLVVYRRRRASHYRGLHEAELGEVHRSI